MTIKRMCFIASLILCAALLFNGCGNPDKGKLLFQPEIGQTWTVHINSASSMNTKAGPVDMTIGQSNDVEMSMTPTAIDDKGVVTLNVVYENADVEISGLDALPGGGKIAGMEDPFGIKAMKDALGLLKGESFQLRVARNGELLSAEGADAIADKVAGSLKTSNNPLMMQADEMVRKSLNNEGIVASLKQYFMSAPDTKLKPGDSWPGSYVENTMLGKMNVDRTMTVTEVSDNTVKASTTLQCTVDPGNNPMMGDSGSITGTGSGTAAYNMDSGWPTEIVETGKMSHEVKTPMGSAKIELSFKLEIRAYPK